MKSILSLTLIVSSLALAFPAIAQEPAKGEPAELEATAFNSMIHSDPVPVLLDVRTAEEYLGGHIEGAVNIDWYDTAFSSLVSGFDRNRMVLVYCLSGKRSASAADRLRGMGFKTVVNLKGGIMQWRAAGLPEAGGTAAATGMTRESFQQTVSGDKLILVDFYAEWCQPCKKMKPYLEEIAAEMAATVTVLRLDADANRQLCKDLKVDGLPVLQLYRSGELLWNNTGFIEKAAVVEVLRRY